MRTEKRRSGLIGLRGLIGLLLLDVADVDAEDEQAGGLDSQSSAVGQAACLVQGVASDDVAHHAHVLDGLLAGIVVALGGGGAGGPHEEDLGGELGHEAAVDFVRFDLGVRVIILSAGRAGLMT